VVPSHPGVWTFSTRIPPAFPRTTRIAGLTRAVTAIVLIALLAGPVATAPAAGLLADDRHDRVTLADGRVFTGEIVEETDDAITMKVVFRGITTTQTWSKGDVLEVLHDVVPVEGRDEAKPAGTAARDEAAPGPDDHVVYILPLRDIIGFDAFPRILRRLWAEATEAGADTVIIEFEAQGGSSDLEEFRDLLQDIKAEADENEIELVLWMKECLGPAVAYALMFEEIYFYPGAIMGGGESLDEALKESWDDPYVLAKMISAWVGICRGMAEEGGYDATLVEAMIRPELVLSYEMDGRTPRFYPDTTSGRPIDTSDEDTLWLDAEQAQQFGICKDVVGSVDALMYELDHRDYVIYEGTAEELTEAWIDGWREANDEILPAMFQELEDIDGFDESEEWKLGSRLRIYKDMKRLIRRFPPIAKAPYGRVSEQQVDFWIEETRKQIQDLNERKREDR